MKFLKIVVFILIFTANHAYSQNNYQSPYTIKYSYSKDSLIYDILNTERGNLKNSAETPYSQWYSPRIEKTYGSWGPQAKHYSYPEYISGKPAEWLRERIIAVAQMFIGYGYQHHHVPDWDPPSNWKWNKTCAGSNGKGVDCSNFTAFVYNMAMGIKLTSNIRKQSEQISLSKVSNGKFNKAVKIPKPRSFADYKNTFKPGDLLFINNNKGKINHVVIWLGQTGISPDGEMLVMDSHGSKVKDSNGKNIPCGIHIRPFRENSWYNNSFQYALRVIQ